MSISSRSRSLRARATRASERRGVSLGRGLDLADATGETDSWSRLHPTRASEGPTGLDGLPFADAQTVRDLDLFPDVPGAPSLHTLLDRTRTAGGRRALTQMLTSGRVDPATIQRRQEAIRFFSDPSIRDRWALRTSGRSLTQLERYLDSYVPPLSGPRGPIYAVRAIWYRASWAKYFEYLDSCVRSLHRFVRGLIEARTEQGGDVPAGIAACRQALDQLLENETVVRFSRAGGRYSRFRPSQTLHFDERFRRELSPLLAGALEAIHQLDLLLSLGEATESLSLVFPDVLSEPVSGDSAKDRNGTVPLSPPQIVCEGLSHPFLAEPVANDVVLDTEQGFLFLTGPNMAGKTTLMKALGIAVYMAHLGLPVPCRNMRLGLLDGIVSSLNVEDNLGKGYSLFYAEVRRVKDVAVQLRDGRRLLVIFDELFRGTNLKDALDGSRLVVDGFRTFPGSLFVLSSHLFELGEELASSQSAGEVVKDLASSRGDGELEREFAASGDDGDRRDSLASARGDGGPGAFRIPIRLLRFDAQVEDGRPSFSYRLRPGVSTDRLGLLILRNEGVPDLLQGPGQRHSPSAERDG